jgi:hybrid cluster-associated redox disulfide protein
LVGNVIIGLDSVAKITEDTTLAEILERPEKKEVLVKYNLPCLGCPFAQMEMDKLKLGEICKVYKINLKALLKEINEV